MLNLVNFTCEMLLAIQNDESLNEKMDIMVHVFSELNDRNSLVGDAILDLMLDLLKGEKTIFKKVGEGLMNTSSHPCPWFLNLLVSLIGYGCLSILGLMGLIERIFFSISIDPSVIMFNKVNHRSNYKRTCNFND